MCELMGLCFAQPVLADFSMHAFAGGDADNPDGWGVAWYPDRSLSLVKESLTWRRSGFAQFLEKYPGLESRIFIAHIRKQTTGGQPTHADTHPFSREFHGQEYCFAHNGTIRNYRELDTTLFQPIGSTDSERVFCHLLSSAEHDRVALNTEDGWAWLLRFLQQINAAGSINCLLSDGERLFIYRDVWGWKGLALRKIRFRNQDQRRFEDETSEVSVTGDFANSGFVCATRPLSATGWHVLARGSLTVLEGGNLRFSSDVGEDACHTPAEHPSAAETGLQ